jgi:hypothetical protein
MSVKYCAFWYPTIFHGELEIKNPGIKSKDISDKNDNGTSHHVSIELCDNKNLVVTSYSDNEGTQIQAKVTLEYLDNTKSGFYLYQFNIEGQSSEAIFLEKAIPHSVYHLAKSFYHEHELDEGGGDAILHALIKDKKDEIKIRGRNNDCLKHYLGIYESKFRAYAESISKQNAFIKYNENDSGQYFLNNSVRRPLLIKACENAIIEYVYCKSILGSKHNRSGHHNIFDIFNNRPEADIVDDDRVLSESDDELYKIALNIRNALRYITFVKETNWIAYSMYSTRVTHIYNQQIRESIETTQNIARNMQDGVNTLQGVTATTQNGVNTLQQVATTVAQITTNTQADTNQIISIQDTMDASIKSNNKLGKIGFFIALISLVLGILSVLIAKNLI